MIKIKTLVAALFILLGVPAVAEDELYDHIFTTHTYDALPTDSHEVLNFQQEKVILFLKWKGLEKEKINEIRYVVKDGVGNIVAERDSVFKSASGRRNTWLRYKFKADRDFPGDWYFLVYLNNKKHLEKMIYVAE